MGFTLPHRLKGLSCVKGQDFCGGLPIQGVLTVVVTRNEQKNKHRKCIDTSVFSTPGHAGPPWKIACWALPKPRENLTYLTIREML